MFILFVLATLVVTSRSHFAAAVVAIAVIAQLDRHHRSCRTSIQPHRVAEPRRRACSRYRSLSVVIAQAVFGPGRVTWHRVQGAIVLYMNFALFFFIAYQLIDHVVADAFVGLPKVGSEYGSGAALLYFSFGSLTSVELRRHPSDLSACAQSHQSRGNDRAIVSGDAIGAARVSSRSAKGGANKETADGRDDDRTLSVACVSCRHSPL